MPANHKQRVLFVCMGNICRSPTGEGVLRHLVEARGLEDEIEIASAGTMDHHVGEPPDPRMAEAAAARGYSLTSRARHFTPADFERFDLIVAMDRLNQRVVLSKAPSPEDRRKVRLFSQFIPETREIDVPDPYYGGEEGFEKVMDMIEEGCRNLLDRLTRDGDGG